MKKGSEKTTKLYKVAISVPNEAFVLPEAYENHIMLAAHQGRLEERWKNENRPIQYEFHRFTTGRLLTAMAREKLVGEALKAGMDYIIMEDNDMIYPIDFVESMLYDIEEHPEIDILAPLAFMRNPPYYPVMYTTIEGYDDKEHQAYFINNLVKKYPKDTLVECDAVGFGAVLIKMDLVKRMKAPYFMSTTGTGEDIWFCVKSKQDYGARVFMDTRIKLGHLSRPPVIDEEYFERYIKETNHDLGVDAPHKYLKESR